MQRTIFSLLFAVVITACGGAAESFDDGEANVAAASIQFFTVQRDERRCPAPGCGGFWAKSVLSEGASPSYVVDLDFSKAGLSQQDEAAVRAAPSDELLFKGRLSSADKRALRKLTVNDVYRGMPGIVPASADTLYSIAAQTATQVASGKSSAVKTISVARASKGFVEQEWLTNRIAAHGALAAAHLASGVMDASQVYLHLPETKGPCLAAPSITCAKGQVPAFARNADRCLIPAGCVTPGVCPMFVPACGDGYTRTQWASAPSGCLAVACDPAWVSE